MRLEALQVVCGAVQLMLSLKSADGLKAVGDSAVSSIVVDMQERARHLSDYATAFTLDLGEEKGTLTSSKSRKRG